MKSPSERFSYFAEKYGAILFDLSSALSSTPSAGKKNYQKILLNLAKTLESESYEKYERTWVLAVTAKTLATGQRSSPYPFTPAERVMLDSNPEPKSRLRYLTSYLRQLRFSEQWMVLGVDRRSGIDTYRSQRDRQSGSARGGD
jgi:hypothetical protein